jgi:preprotein translocase subunit SecB
VSSTTCSAAPDDSIGRAAVTNLKTEDEATMTEETTPAAAAADPNAPVVLPQAIYIKDCSFEAPNGPFLASGQQTNPSVSLNLGTRATALAQDLHEVVLQVNLEAKAGDRTVWLLELQQAGAFTVRNLSAADVAQVLSIMAPNYLMAYARATISDLVIKGGFPPFLLPLVTFEALHARAAQQQALQPKVQPNTSVN